MRDFLTILFKPRETMRRILERGSRATLPLVLLASCAAAIGDVDGASMRRILEHQKAPVLALIVVSIVATLLVSVALFYLFAWGATFIGKFLEGNGSARDVRLALAWGLVPLIWSLVYRIPVAISTLGKPPRLPVGGEQLSFNPGLLADGCFAAALFAAAELIVLIGWLVITSFTLAEAHRFSVWRGLGTLAATAAVPLVVTAAVVFAFMM